MPVLLVDCGRVIKLAWPPGRRRVSSWAGHLRVARRLIEGRASRRAGEGRSAPAKRRGRPKKVRICPADGKSAGCNLQVQSLRGVATGSSCRRQFFSSLWSCVARARLDALDAQHRPLAVFVFGILLSPRISKLPSDATSHWTGGRSNDFARHNRCD